MDERTPSYSRECFVVRECGPVPAAPCFFRQLRARTPCMRPRRGHRASTLARPLCRPLGRCVRLLSCPKVETRRGLAARARALSGRPATDEHFRTPQWTFDQVCRVMQPHPRGSVPVPRRRVGVSQICRADPEQFPWRRRGLRKMCHSQITRCHLRHSPRPRTPMGGDGVANGARADAGPAERRANGRGAARPRSTCASARRQRAEPRVRVNAEGGALSSGPPGFLPAVRDA